MLTLALGGCATTMQAEAPQQKCLAFHDAVVRDACLHCATGAVDCERPAPYAPEDDGTAALIGAQIATQNAQMAVQSAMDINQQVTQQMTMP